MHPPPLLLPQMMGMMQVMSSPCLIPQPNGPPLLINMPSYVYPNMVAPGSSTGVLNPGSLVGQSPGMPGSFQVGAPQVVLPGQATLRSNLQDVPGGSRDLSQRPVSSSHNSSSLKLSTATLGTNLRRPDLTLTPTRSETSTSQQPQNTSPRISTGVCFSEQEDREATAEEQGLVLLPASNAASSPQQRPKESNPPPLLTRRRSPVPQTSSPLTKNVSSPAPVPSTSNTVKVSGPLKLKIKNRKDIMVESRMPIVRDTELSEAQPEEDLHPVLSQKASASPPTTTSVTPIPSTSGTPTKGNGVFGFTQYAEDSPYPAASLNFSNMLDSQAQSSEAPQPVDKPPEERSSTNKVYTVQTVSDLQNALKSDDDVQIVVPNELLETSEFKSFISTLNSFPLHESSNSHPHGESSSNDCTAPPNTPAQTRPPSAASSPQPCSSRDVSRGGFIEEEEGAAKDQTALPDSDDDITLQDLVAMETMEDADVCEDDQFFTLTNSTNPLEPFMNAILQVPATASPTSESTSFSCEKCGFHFDCIKEFRKHNDMCHSKSSSTSKGKKSAKGGIKNRSKTSAASTNPTAAVTRSPPPDENATVALEDKEPAWILPEDVKTEVKSEINSETQDSSSQPVLADPGQHWKCNQCKVVFETGPQLLEHLDQMRRSENNCEACHIIFDDRKLLLLHRRKFHSAPKIKTEQREQLLRDLLPNENGEFICDKCDRAFKSRELLIKHMSCHNEERPFECLECGKKFTKPSLLRDHRRRHFEVGQFECGYCQKRFYTPNKLREHVRIHTGEAPLSCNVCGKTFKRHSNLTEHKRIHQADRPVKPPKELFCHCGKVFKTQRDLDWHKEGEHDKQPKKCTYCGEVFVHGSSLTRHIRLKHESNFLPQNKKSSLYAKCPVCNQMFYKTSINKHIRIKHQGQKPYKCDVCGSSFVTKCNLLNHQWQHRGVRARPFKCQLCSKAYLRQSLLDAHMRSHRGVKPFVCNECGLQFANKSNWQRHVAEHSGARNYECPHCHKRFSRGYYLTDHLKVHTGEKPYACGICGKMAATRSNYNSHLRTHITREPVNSEV